MTETVPDPLDVPVVELRRHRGLLALLVVAAIATATAYAWRGLTDGSAVHLAVAAALAVVAVINGIAWVDARGPVLVADDQGIRLRQGRAWHGLPWVEVWAVDLHPRSGLRDPHLDVLVGSGDSERTYVLPLGMGTLAASPDLMETLDELARGRAQVRLHEQPDPNPVPGSADATAPSDRQAPAVPPARESKAPSVRPTAATVPTARRAVRANVNRTSRATIGALALSPDTAALPEIKELRGTEGRVGLVLEQLPVGPDTVVEPQQLPPGRIDDYAAVPAVEPVIGPQLLRARERLRQSVDTVADRTRIRPHVIEAIEVDDFGPCGGDFYARGHLRSLAAVLGLDPEPLVRTFDERYASGPIQARTVFQAELATGPQSSIKLASGGPNWWALIATVLVLAIVWAVAQLVTARTDQPASAVDSTANVGFSAPDPDRFAGLGAPTTNQIVLRATGQVRVVVRTDEGEPVWEGPMRRGGTREVAVPGFAHVTVSGPGGVVARINDTTTRVIRSSTVRLGRS